MYMHSMHCISDTCKHKYEIQFSDDDVITATDPALEVVEEVCAEKLGAGTDCDNFATTSLLSVDTSWRRLL